MSKADQILEKVLTELNLVNANSEEKFQNVYNMFPILDRLNQEDTFSVSTTGTITERVVPGHSMLHFPLDILD